MNDEQKKDDRFRAKLVALLQWVADRDPAAAMRLMSDFADDLFDELGPAAEARPRPR